jgi:hypothetical protein
MHPPISLKIATLAAPGLVSMYNCHVGFSVGYEKFISHVNVNKPNFNGSLNPGYSGLLVNVYSYGRWPAPAGAGRIHIETFVCRG